MGHSARYTGVMDCVKQVRRGKDALLLFFSSCLFCALGVCKIVRVCMCACVLLLPASFHSSHHHVTELEMCVCLRVRAHRWSSERAFWACGVAPQPTWPSWCPTRGSCSSALSSSSNCSCGRTGTRTRPSRRSRVSRRGKGGDTARGQHHASSAHQSADPSLLCLLFFFSSVFWHPFPSQLPFQSAPAIAWYFFLSRATPQCTCHLHFLLVGPIEGGGGCHV